jgi:hypothetical protein
VNPNNKDTLIHLSENLLINLDELENLNRTELGNLKSLITQSAIRLRKAYGLFSENYVRRASFMGSVNDAEFLTDTTGNRRYLCFTVTEIDTDHKLDMDLIYGQAYSLLKSKFKWWFDKDEIEQINRNNDDYLRMSTEEELLLKYFKKPEGDDQITEKTPTELLVFFEARLDTTTRGLINTKRIGQALVKNGFRKISVKNKKPYLLSRIDQQHSARASDEGIQINNEQESTDSSNESPGVQLLIESEKTKPSLSEFLAQAERKESK